MIIFEAAATHGIDRDGSVSLHDRDIFLDDPGSFSRAGDLFMCPQVFTTGLEPTDFAVFAIVMDNEGAWDVPLIVVEHRRTGEAVLVAYSLMRADLGRFVTNKVARDIRRANPEKLRQFNIEELVNFVRLDR